jgi:tripartite-type tricarboxylate transporter receptor subunit TctC
MHFSKSFAVPALIALFASAGSAVADYPDHAVKVVVPFPPGGPTDIVARPYADALSATTGQPVVIENHGGAGGSVGAASVAKSNPDGYTLLLGTVGTAAINPALYPKLPYDPVKDFRTLAVIASAPVVLVAHPSVNAHDIKSLRALAAKQDLRFGSAGNGTPGHLTGEIFKSASGIPLTHVPYKGSAAAIQDVMGGHIELLFDPLQSVYPHIRAGKLKIIAVSSAKRSPQIADVPTFIESGVKAETQAWWGLFAPAGTPDAEIEILRQQVLKARNSEKVIQLQQVGIDLDVVTQQKQLDAFLAAEQQKWGSAVKSSGATID